MKNVMFTPARSCANCTHCYTYTRICDAEDQRICEYYGGDIWKEVSSDSSYFTTVCCQNWDGENVQPVQIVDATPKKKKTKEKVKEPLPEKVEVNEIGDPVIDDEYIEQLHNELKEESFTEEKNPVSEDELAVLQAQLDAIERAKAGELPTKT